MSIWAKLEALMLGSSEVDQSKRKFLKISAGVVGAAGVALSVPLTLLAEVETLVSAEGGKIGVGELDAMISGVSYRDPVPDLPTLMQQTDEAGTFRWVDSLKAGYLYDGHVWFIAAANPNVTAVWA